MGTGSVTIQDAGRARRSSDATHPYLFVVFDCDAPHTGGARYALTNLDVVTIGRGELRGAVRGHEGARRHLELRLPGSFISSTHAHLRHEGASWVLEDAQSRNGSFVNGARVTRALLRDRDLIEIGHTLLCFRAALPSPPDTAEDLDSATLSPLAPGLATLHPQLAGEFAAIARIARSPVPALFLGESGAGKEVMARAIHTLSGRPGAFVAVNCGALTGSLLESQLFGHLKGAFTGAVRDEPGFVRAADHGTLFLDEIGDLPLPAQAALLRVLQEREVVPVGGTRPVQVDLRVVAATQRPLDQMTTDGDFRSDLLARLSGYRYPLWPLRQRREDLGLLVADLLRRERLASEGALRFSPDAARRLLGHEWPLNVRELFQCLTVSTVLASEGVIEPAHLPELTHPPEPARETATPQPSAPTEDPAELRQTLIRLLALHQGVVSQVARELGKTRAQIHRWL